MAMFVIAPGSEAIAADLPPVKVQNVGSQRIPTELPDYLASVRTLAKQWQPDAELTVLTVRMNDDTPWTTLRFYSERANQGLDLSPDLASGYQVVPLPEYSDSRYPLLPDFVDLPRALGVAREHGLRGPLGQAMLMIFQPSDRAPVLAWQFSGNAPAAFYVDALSGAHLTGDVSGNLQYLEGEWQRASDALRSYFTRLQQNSQPADGGSDGCGLERVYASEALHCSFAGGDWYCGWTNDCICTKYVGCD